MKWVREEYYSLLKSYYNHQDEKFLYEAAKLGKKLVYKNIPAEDIAELHEYATKRLGNEFPDAKLSETAQLIATPLIEILISYGLAFQELLEEHKRSEEVLRNKECHYRELFENSPVPLWEEDFSEIKKNISNLKKAGIKDFREYFDNNPEKISEYAKMIKILEVNNLVLKLHEAKSKDELLGGLQIIFTDESFNAFREELIAISEGRTYCEFEGEVKTLNGRKKNIFLRWTVVPGYEKTMERVFISTIDITKRKRMERALKNSKSQLELIIDKIPGMLAYVNKEQKYIYVNQSYANFYKLSKEKFIGKRVKDILPPYIYENIKGKIKQVLSGQTLSFETVFILEDGQEKIVLAEYIPHLDKQGNVIAFLATIQDITERKRAEREIYQKTEDLTLIGLLNDAVNKGKSLREITQLLSDATKKLFSCFGITLYLLSDDKKYLEMRNLSLPSRIVSQIEKLIGIKIPDIRIPLVPGSRYLKTLESGEAELINDPKIIQEMMMEFTENKLLKMLVAKIYKILDIRSVLNAPLVSAGNAIGLLDISRKEPFTSSDLKRFKIILEELTAIIKRKQAEEALKENELKYRLLANFTYDWEYWLDPDGNYIYLSPSCERITGYKPKEFEKNPELLFQITKPEYYDIVHSHYKHENNNEGMTATMEFPIITKTGEERWLVHNCCPVYDDQGNYMGRRGNNRDITKRKQMELERERLSAATEQSTEAVVITDTNGNIEYVNFAFEKSTGYSREEVLGQNSRILKSGEHEEAFYKELWDTVSEGRVWQSNMISRCKDSSLITEKVTISPIFDKGGDISNYVAVKRNITKELKMEAQIQQTRKMEAIGQLAGGIAHDFNNILTAIAGFSEIGKMRTQDQEFLYNLFQNINNTGERATSLVKKLLGFSRKQVITPEIINITDCIKDINKMLMRMIPEDIDISLNLSESPQYIFADVSQLEQVLINLVVNARDAINMNQNAKNKTISISTTTYVTDDYEYIFSGRLEPGDYVLISVKDTGVGIEKDEMKRIFEPFYTTKAVGEGTGMGLATVWGIVKQNKGYINLSSEIERGTTFNIFWPVTTYTQSKPDMEKPVIEYLKGSETIILVEDDPEILSYLELGLSSIGYTVLTFDNVEKALDKIDEHKKSIDLIITDIVMPKINGKQFIDILQSRKKNIKVLYMSGHTNDYITNIGLDVTDIDFIKKPFSLEDLTIKIRKILNNA